ncbi:replicative DNA helicase [Candidatus Vidania fulgoroideorum]
MKYKAEQFLLSSIILKNNNFNKVSKIINENNFIKKKNGVIFKSIKNMLNKNNKIDVITLFYYIKKNNKLQNISFKYINGIIKNNAIFDNIVKYAKIIKNKYLLKKIYENFYKFSYLIKNKKIKNIFNFVSRVQNKLKSFLKKNYKNDKFKIKKKLKIVYHNIINKKYSNNTYIKTGFSKLDNLILGFSPGELIVIAGRPSTGKTSLCMNICENISIKNKLSSIFFSLEMSKEQVILRLLSSISGINSKKIKGSSLDKKEKKKLKYAYKKIKKSSIFINDNSFFNLYNFKSNLKKIFTQNKIGIIAIDYLQLVYLKRNKDSRNNEIAEISRILKTVSKEFNVPVVALSQLNRNSDQRINKRPILSDLKDSGSIEQDADLIIFLYNNLLENKNIVETELIIGKNRNGPTGVIKLDFDKSKTKFIDK